MSRRKHQKMIREKWGRERVLDERREQEERRKRREENRITNPERVMWREFTEEVRGIAKRENPPTYQGWGTIDAKLGRGEITRVVRVDERDFQPTPQHLIGVVTHPVPEFTKSRTYPHQPMEEPSHLWCDSVHATDADVMRGNQKKG